MRFGLSFALTALRRVVLIVVGLMADNALIRADSTNDNAAG